MTQLPDLFRRFAETEAHGVSPLYERLTLAAAGSPTVMRFVESLPENRRQPQLLLAAIRAVAALPEDLAGLEAVLEARKRAMLEVNVPGDALDAVIEVLPCMREPTVSPLHSSGGFAVKAAVPRDRLAQVIPAVRQRGGTDIIVTNPEQIVP